MISLTEPNFIDRDPQAITADLVAKWEALADKTLYPAQLERLLIDVIAYAKTMTHIGIQEACKQNLVRFAGDPILDYLGELVDTDRLPEAAAHTVLRFSLTAGLQTDIAIAAGALAESGDGKISFASDIGITLPAGQLSVEVAATCGTVGTIGNGWQPGQINVLARDLGDVAISVANLTVSSGGADAESTERYRSRLLEAPESYSVAGSRGAYRFHAMAAHQSIIDVGVVGPRLILVDGEVISTNQVPPGEVRVYPLVGDGVPEEGILALVAARLDDETVRPLCDFVQLLPPEAVDYAVVVGLYLYDSADEATVLATVRAKADVFAADLASGLGRDVVEKAWVATLKVAGVYDLDLDSPLTNLVVEDYQWARCTGITITVAGVVHG